MGISPKLLRKLRNDIPVDDVITRILRIEYRHREGHLRWLCPKCGDLHTSTNKKTNLARCFLCKVNFNPIDLLMEVNKFSFKQAVGLLETMLEHYEQIKLKQESNRSNT